MKMTRSRRRGLALAAGALVMLLAACMVSACDTSVPPAPKTPQTPAQPSTSASVSPAIRPLPLPPTGALLPSPDGMLVATLATQPAAVTLYDLSGTVRAAYQAPSGVHVTATWLSDSSGVFIWSTDESSAAVLTMDRNGNQHSTGLTAADPLLSPDGQWVAGGALGASPQQDAVEVIPRAGGSVRTLAQGADFLGWLNDRVAFVTQGAVYTIAADGMGKKLVANIPSGLRLQELDVAPSSPDDHVTILQGGKGIFWTLTATALRQLPPNVIQGLPVFWVGGHQALGSDAHTGDLAIIDVATGAEVRDIGVSASGVALKAVSGMWAAFSLVGQSSDLYVLNYQTGTRVDLGTLAPGMNVLAGGTGTFLLHVNGGSTYLADPALAGT